MFAGEVVNKTEDRAALHVALRDLSTREYHQKGEGVSHLVRSEQDKMRRFCASVLVWRLGGLHRGEPLDTVVNIGIGGSDLGPQMAG